MPLTAVGIIGQRDLVGLAIDIASMIGDRMPQLQQRVLEFAALGRVDQDGFGIDAFAELSDEIGLADELVEQSRLRCGQGQPVDRMVDEREHTETVHDVDDVDEEFVRDRVLREFEEHVDDGFGIMTAGACVPQSQRSDLIGVDVLRGPRQLCERGDRHGRLDGEGMSRFQQHSPIGLHDQRTIHSILPFRSVMTPEDTTRPSPRLFPLRAT